MIVLHIINMHWRTFLEKKIRNNYLSIISVYLISHISWNNMIDCSNSLTTCTKVLLFFLLLFFFFLYHVGFYCAIRIISTVFEEETALLEREEEEEEKENRPSFVLILHVLSFLEFLFFLVLFSFYIDWQNKQNRFFLLSPPSELITDEQGNG